MVDKSKRVITLTEITTIVTSVWFKKHADALKDDADEHYVQLLIADLRSMLDSIESQATRMFIIEQLFYLDDLPEQTAFAVECLCFEYAGDSMTLQLQEDVGCSDVAYDKRYAVLVSKTSESTILEHYLLNASREDEDCFHDAVVERLHSMLSGKDTSLSITVEIRKLFQGYVDKALPGRCALTFASKVFADFHTADNLARLQTEATAENHKRSAEVLGYALEDVRGEPSTRPIPKAVGL